MKTRSLLAFLCLSAIALLSGCKKEDASGGGTDPTKTEETLPLVEQSLDIIFPEEVPSETLQELRVSTVYGESKLQDNALRSTETQALKKYSSFKHTNKGLMIVQLVDKQDNMQMCMIQEPNIKPMSMSIDETALSILMLTPPLITDNTETYRRTKAQLRALPEFNDFRQKVQQEYLLAMKEKRAPYYGTIQTGQVLMALLRKSFENYQVEQSGLSIRDVQQSGTGKITFAVQNDRRRVVHIYGRQVWMDKESSASTKLVVKQEKELPLWHILNSESASYWGILKGSWLGDKSSIYKSTSPAITVDIADADKLFIDVYGAGKLDKPFSSLTTTEQLRYLMVWVHSAYNDVITPFINLVYGTKELAEASGTDNYRYDLRYGLKTNPLGNLLHDLTEALRTDSKLMKDLAESIDKPDYWAIPYQISEFCLHQIVGNNQSPEVKRRHLNNLYNAYKQLFRISRTEDSFRADLKKLANQLSHAKNANFASKVIKVSELTLDLSGTIYAILESEGKSTFIIDKKGNLEEAQDQEDDKEQTGLPEGVVIENGVLKKWPSSGVPVSGHISIPQEVTAIGDNAFFGVSNLRSVSLPKKLKSIGLYAFQNCTSLEELNLPESVTTIGRNAFYNCSSLKRINIPPKVLSIEATTLYKCASLERIDTQNVQVIKESAFAECYALKEITMSNALTRIEQKAFRQCISLASLTLPNSVNSIASECFEDCSRLKDISLPKSLSHIDYHLFNKCTSLESIIIPQGITGINSTAFENCQKLKTINIRAINPPSTDAYYMSSGGVKVPEGLKLIVPVGRAEFYRVHRSWKHISNIVEED